jgi:hypothetical protein
MWDSFYDTWLANGGDSTTLMYLVHRHKYLKNKNPKSQEHINLIKQIRAILSLSYTGAYSSALEFVATVPQLDMYRDFLSVPLSDAIMEEINLALYNISEFNMVSLLENMDKLDLSINTISKKMQKIPEVYWTHPIWILWCYIFDRQLTDDERYILVCYRFVFWYYFHREEYQKASQIYILALNPQQRDSPLPLLSPEVLRANME